MTMPIINCLYCDKKVKKKSRAAKYCSKYCYGKSSLDRFPKIIITCALCNSQVEKTKSKLKLSKSGYRFCSRKCKDKAQRVLSGFKSLWPSHYDTEHKTKGSSSESAVCNKAKTVYDSLDRPYRCYICHDSSYTEIAHIKPRSSFSPDAKIQEINSGTNMIRLCPNHHKEYDILKYFSIVLKEDYIFM